VTRCAKAEVRIGVAELDDGLGALRLCAAAELDVVRQSLERHGQLQPLIAFHDAGVLKVLDGHKRLRAARGLGWTELRTSIVEVEAIEAKVWLFELHRHQGLSELEEAWVIRSLCRDDGLTQGAIAHRLGRDKSWVSRRLLLVEGLDEAVQADVRLGLLAPRAAVALSPLPRGNVWQGKAAAVVIRRGMTVRQTERMVAEILAAPSQEQWQPLLARFDETGGNTATRSGARKSTAPRDADAIQTEVDRLLSASTRLQVRLLQAPHLAWTAERTGTLAQALQELVRVLAALTEAITAIIEGKTPIVSSQEDS
jgi:ParB/RepB/Spo0J family partition protein